MHVNEAGRRGLTKHRFTIFIGGIQKQTQMITPDVVDFIGMESLCCSPDGPKPPSVSVSPPGDIVEGSPVTLTCSSDANPAANYTWYKGNQTLLHGPGDIYHFVSISSKDVGVFHCKSENQYGQVNSSSTVIDVQCKYKTSVSQLHRAVQSPKCKFKVQLELWGFSVASSVSQPDSVSSLSCRAAKSKTLSRCPADFHQTSRRASKAEHITFGGRSIQQSSFTSALTEVSECIPVESITNRAEGYSLVNYWLWTFMISTRCSKASVCVTDSLQRSNEGQFCQSDL